MNIVYIKQACIFYLITSHHQLQFGYIAKPTFKKCERDFYLFTSFESMY